MLSVSLGSWDEGAVEPEVQMKFRVRNCPFLSVTCPQSHFNFDIGLALVQSPLYQTTWRPRPPGDISWTFEGPLGYSSSGRCDSAAALKAPFAWSCKLPGWRSVLAQLGCILPSPLYLPTLVFIVFIQNARPLLLQPGCLYNTLERHLP